MGMRMACGVWLVARLVGTHVARGACVRAAGAAWHARALARGAIRR
jgi:hypothetical protein